MGRHNRPFKTTQGSLHAMEYLIDSLYECVFWGGFLVLFPAYGFIKLAWAWGFG